MIGLPTTVSVEDVVGATPAPACTAPPVSSSRHVAHRARQLGLASRDASSRRTRGSSGPRRTGSAGSSRRRDASTSPVAQVAQVAGHRRRTDVERHPERDVVEPRPDRDDRAPSCTATVAVQSPARSVRWSVASTWWSHVEPGELPVAFERLDQPLEIADRDRPGPARGPPRSAGARPDRPRSRGRRPPCAPPGGGAGSRAARRPPGRRRCARGSPAGGRRPVPCRSR